MPSQRLGFVFLNARLNRKFKQKTPKFSRRLKKLRQAGLLSSKAAFAKNPKTALRAKFTARRRYFSDFKTA